MLNVWLFPCHCYLFTDVTSPVVYSIWSSLCFVCNRWCLLSLKLTCVPGVVCSLQELRIFSRTLTVFMFKKHHPCIICGRAFRYINSLQRHIRNLHKKQYTAVVTDDVSSIPTSAHDQAKVWQIPTKPDYHFVYHSTPLSPDGSRLIHQEQASIAETTLHTHCDQISSAGFIDHKDNEQPVNPGAESCLPCEKPLSDSATHTTHWRKDASTLGIIIVFVVNYINKHFYIKE